MWHHLEAQYDDYFPLRHDSMEDTFEAQFGDHFAYDHDGMVGFSSLDEFSDWLGEIYAGPRIVHEA